MYLLHSTGTISFLLTHTHSRRARLPHVKLCLTRSPSSFTPTSNINLIETPLRKNKKQNLVPHQDENHSHFSSRLNILLPIYLHVKSYLHNVPHVNHTQRIACWLVSNLVNLSMTDVKGRTNDPCYYLHCYRMTSISLEMTLSTIQDDYLCECGLCVFVQATTEQTPCCCDCPHR